MSSYQPLTDSQWESLKSMFPEPVKRGRGKPHTPWRAVVNSILFVLMTGAKWATLPKLPEFASKSASHRWFVLWDKDGTLDKILALLNAHADALASITYPLRRQRTPAPLDLAIEPALAVL